MKTWEYDEDEGDWRYATGTYTAIVWIRPDGWWVKIGFDPARIVVHDKGQFKTREDAQAHAEEIIAKQEAEG